MSTYFISLLENSKYCKMTYAVYYVKDNSIFSGEGTASSNGKSGTYKLIYSKTEKCYSAKVEVYTHI